MVNKELISTHNDGTCPKATNQYLLLRIYQEPRRLEAKSVMYHSAYDVSH